MFLNTHMKTKPATKTDCREGTSMRNPNPSLVITLWKHQMKFFACWGRLRPQKMYGIYFKSQPRFHPSWAAPGLSRCSIEAPSVPMKSFSFESTVSGSGSELRKKMPTHEDSIKAVRPNIEQRLRDDHCLN